MNDNFKAKLYDVETLDDYIKIYEESFDNMVDLSPYCIQSSTEKKMIEELKKLNKLMS